MEKEFKKLLADIKSYNNKAEVTKIKKAWEFAKLAHYGQNRLSGDPYVSHPLAVAQVLAGWKLDQDSIIAGFLHDTIEDGGANRNDILTEFGEDVSHLVDGVTKVSGVKLRTSKDEEFIENLRKMFLAMARDLRVVLIKLADRLHNMQTLSVLPVNKQKRIARETIEVYAPLAERLGIGELNGQLQDLAFPFVYPAEYKKVKRESRIHYAKVDKVIEKMERDLYKKLAQEGVRAKIHSRKKHLYSLWRKIERPEIAWDFSKIHDVVALRILVDKTPQCYTALGLVHKLYKPVPYLGISDFIAQPKPNGYQSIHTKVFGPEGKIAEIQIRTEEMHEYAEHGYAAHWYMSEQKSKGNITSHDIETGLISPGTKLKWVQQLADWQKEISDSREFLKAVKFDALGHRIYVFSPKGDAFDLPTGSTPIDFAATVHTDLIDYVKCAKVNEKIAPLSCKLESGDVVEIIKTKAKKPPSRDWLDFVMTATAKKKIKRALEG